MTYGPHTAVIVPLFRAPTPGKFAVLVATLRSGRTEAEVRRALRDDIESGSGVIK